MSGQHVEANAVVVGGMLAIAGGESILDTDEERALYRLMRQPIMGNDRPTPRRIVLPYDVA